ncbi:sensor histidine kinase [Ekhidna sp.]|uniref:sensor histidine kinase n=1 Tax=Ekhidna sp. TaxID=2608089 RepID=UPI003B5958D7
MSGSDSFANSSFKINWRKELKEGLLIYLFGGILQFLLWGNLDLGVSSLIINFTYSGFMWVMLWKGSEASVVIMNALYSWQDNPVKRFIASFFTIVLYTAFVVYFLDFGYDVIVFGKSALEAIQKLNGAPLITTILVNLAINTFMHGRGFLLEWRQAAIDNERLKTEQVASQYNSLKNQVNPHFLFNSLNVLSSLVYENQDKAVEFIRKLSNVYRYVLDSKDEEVVSIHDEMEFVKNFAFLQKIRFGENLQIKIEEASSNTYVPPLAIQVLVENAIKHNVVSEKDPLHVAIDFEEDLCTVRNNLKEKKVKDSTGIGLENLIARYEYLTDRKVSVEKGVDYFLVKLPLLKLKK